MLKSALLALLLAGVSAQQSDLPESKGYEAKRSALLAEISGALSREESQQQLAFCPDASTTIEINQCAATEFTKTDLNYRHLLIALFKLVRLDDSPESRSKQVSRSLDQGDAAWVTYRQKSCTALFESYQGGTAATSAALQCKQALTWSHMKELADTFDVLRQS